jgi:hypothetical protein
MTSIATNQSFCQPIVFGAFRRDDDDRRMLVQRELFFRDRNLFGQQLDLLFLDTLST